MQHGQDSVQETSADDEDQKALARGAKPTTFYNSQIMERDTWYPCNPDMRFKLANLLTMEVVRLTEAEQEVAPRKRDNISQERQTAIENKTYLDETFVGEGPNEHNIQPSPPDIIEPIYYSNISGSSFRSRTASTPRRELEGDHIRPPSDHSFESTQRMEDLTQVVREEAYMPHRKVALPLAHVIPGLSPDITLPRPMAKPPGYFDRPSNVSDETLANRHKFFDSIDASSQPKNIHLEQTLVISDFVDGSQASVVLPETQSTQFLATSSQDLAPNSLPEDIVITGMRASVERQQEGAGKADDREDGSRSGSVVPESPVPSQQDYIPSTPTELIGLSRITAKDPREQSHGEVEDDDDRVPQTPVEEQEDQQKQHTAMSDVSTLEANQLSASIPDSQATQEAIRLSLSSDDQPQHRLDDTKDDVIVKTEEVESERQFFHSLDSQNISLSSPGAVKTEDDDGEGTKVNEDSKPRRHLSREVCPDSQRSTQSSTRDRSREELDRNPVTTTISANITIASTVVASYPQTQASPAPPAPEQEMVVDSPDLSQESDRTASREGSPKHNLETEAASEEPPPKPTKQVKVESTDDVSIAMRSRLRRGASAGRLSKFESVEPHPASTIRTRSSTTMDLEQHSIMISSPNWDDFKQKSVLPKNVGTYNDNAHKDMTVLVFEPIEGKRTCKLMCAIARGLPIVTDAWLKDTISTKHCCSTGDYLYKDEIMEKAFNFTFEDVCAKGKSNVKEGILIFATYEFYGVTANNIKNRVGPNYAELGYLSKDTVKDFLEPMIKICGGRMLARTAKPDPEKKDKTIIIGQTTDDCSVTQAYIAAGFKVMDREFILSSILRQSPELDFETHAIPVREVIAAADAEEDGGAGEQGDAGEQSDATSRSNSKSARSRSRSASAVPSVSRSSSSVRPQRSSSSLSTSSTSSAVAATTSKETVTTGKKKKKATKKK
ncbi:Mediator of DNA damage checkpoint protein 1 [Linnemannia gamsii]|uniref:Mediator of DNA damage checkpoint protein 1 n=1 Tax=Linnemannia gamsii TaxID=64522 RepID=A0ABQ7JV32_9FUNG|nr:Mediator of DNA damage checkpoint protein 1 [Linnemannia gamsii]